MDLCSKNHDSENVNIPLVLEKESLMYNQWLWDEMLKKRLICILSGKNYIDNIYQLSYLPYFPHFPTEIDFWKFETYWILGTVFRERKRKTSIIRKLIDNYNGESEFGKAGILGALSLLNFTSVWTQEKAEELYQSDHPIIVLTSIRMLIEKKSNKNLNIIKRYYIYGAFQDEKFEKIYQEQKKVQTNKGGSV